MKDTWGNPSRFATFKGQMDREEFGIEWNKSLANNQFLIGKDIAFWGKFQRQQLPNTLSRIQNILDTEKSFPGVKFHRKHLNKLIINLQK